MALAGLSRKPEGSAASPAVRGSAQGLAEQRARGRVQVWRHALRVSSRRSRQRITFLAGGCAVGLVAVAFAFLADEMQAVFQRVVARWPLAPLVMTPTLFVAISYVMRRFFPNSRSSGIPQTIAARRIKDVAAADALISIRAAVGKILLTMLGLVSGASVGREGPTIQVGAAIMSQVGKMTRIPRSGLILAGACGGIAAAFNTPLAGIVFGIEEMSQSFERRTSGLTLATVIIAGLISLAFLGNYTYFGTPHAKMPDIADWFVIPLCGALGGFLGALFARIVVRCLLGIPGRIGKFIKAHPLAFAFACGVGVAVCGVLTGGATFGTGYAQARGLLNDARDVAPVFGLTKIVATILSAASGIPGGVFAPSLAIGASLGSTLIAYFPHADPGALFLLGMVSYLTGVIQAPITAFVIVSELADAHGMIIPLMAAAVVAHTISRVICTRGIYHALAEDFMPPHGGEPGDGPDNSGGV